MFAVSPTPVVESLTIEEEKAELVETCQWYPTALAAESTFNVMVRSWLVALSAGDTGTGVDGAAIMVVKESADENELAPAAL